MLNLKSQRSDGCMPLSKVSGSLLSNAYLPEFTLLHIARLLRQEYIPSLSGQLARDLLGENSSKLTAGKSVSLFPLLERRHFPFLCIGNFLATFPCQWPSKSLQNPYGLQRSKYLPSAPHQERFADLWYWLWIGAWTGLARSRLLIWTKKHVWYGSFRTLASCPVLSLTHHTIQRDLILLPFWLSHV